MDPYAQTIINDANSRYFAIDQTQLIDSAGEAIAHMLIKRFGGGKSVAFTCGLGMKGAYGFAAARHLAKLGFTNLTVYLIGRQNELKTELAVKEWALLKQAHINYKQDAFGTDIVKHDIIVDCLTDDYLTTKLFKRFHDVVYRITRLKANLVAIDYPAPGYTWSYSLSFNFPKTADAEVAMLPIPDQVLNHIGPGEVKLIAQPKRFSYKSQNGQMLIVGGSQQQALIHAAQAATNYAAGVYVYAPNNESHSAKGIAYIAGADLESTVERVDSILIGPEMPNNYANRSLVNALLKDYPEKRFVVDSTAIGMIDLALAQACGNVIFIVSRGQLHNLMQAKVAEPSGVLKRFATEHNCCINLQSSNNILFGKAGELKFNASGNSGMTTDVERSALLGLTAAFATKNESWLAMAAAAFVNGIASELATKELADKNTVSELIRCQAKALQLCQEF